MEIFRNLDNLIENRNIFSSGNDFIAIAISGWHLSSIYAHINKVKTLKGIIIIVGFRIKENLILRTNQFNISYYRVEELLPKVEYSKYSILTKIKNHGHQETMDLLTPFGYNLSLYAYLNNLNLKTNFNFIKFDEGMGSYISEYDFVKSYTKKSIIKNILLIIKLMYKKYIINKMTKNGHIFKEFFSL